MKTLMIVFALLACSSWGGQDELKSRKPMAADEPDPIAKKKPRVEPPGFTAIEEDPSELAPVAGFNARQRVDEIKVFALQQAQAGDLADLLLRLFPKTEFAADPRTNAVVARGAAADLMTIEALLLRLDQADSRRAEKVDTAKEQQGSVQVDFTDQGLVVRGDRASVTQFEEVVRGSSEDKLRSRYRTLQQQADTIARTSDTATARTRARSDLHQVVHDAFEARQQLHAIEIQRLRERLERLEERLRMRERIKDEIIDQHTDSLLRDKRRAEPRVPDSDDPRVQMKFQMAPWRDVLELAAQTCGVALQLDDIPPGTFSFESSRQYTPSEMLGVLRKTLARHGYELELSEGQLSVFNIDERGPAPTPVPNVSGDELILRKPTEFHEELVRRRADVRRLQALVEENPVEPEVLEVLEQKRRRMALARAEYEAQLMMLNSALTTASARVAEEQAAYDFAKRLLERGYSSATELKSAEVGLVGARARVDRLRALLKLYQQAGDLGPMAEGATGNPLQVRNQAETDDLFAPDSRERSRANPTRRLPVDPGTALDPSGDDDLGAVGGNPVRARTPDDANGTLDLNDPAGIDPDSSRDPLDRDDPADFNPVLFKNPLNVNDPTGRVPGADADSGPADPVVADDVLRGSDPGRGDEPARADSAGADPVAGEEPDEFDVNPAVRSDNKRKDPLDDPHVDDPNGDDPGTGDEPARADSAGADPVGGEDPDEFDDPAADPNRGRSR